MDIVDCFVHVIQMDKFLSTGKRKHGEPVDLQLYPLIRGMRAPAGLPNKFLSWRETRPWLAAGVLHGSLGMFCILCREHVPGSSRNRPWVDIGCTLMAVKAVKSHEITDRHVASVNLDNTKRYDSTAICLCT